MQLRKRFSVMSVVLLYDAYPSRLSSNTTGSTRIQGSTGVSKTGQITCLVPVWHHFVHSAHLCPCNLLDLILEIAGSSLRVNACRVQRIMSHNLGQPVHRFRNSPDKAEKPDDFASFFTTKFSLQG